MRGVLIFCLYITAYIDLFSQKDSISRITSPLELRITTSRNGTFFDPSIGIYASHFVLSGGPSIIMRVGTLKVFDCSGFQSNLQIHPLSYKGMIDPYIELSYKGYKYSYLSFLQQVAYPDILIIARYKNTIRISEFKLGFGGNVRIFHGLYYSLHFGASYRVSDHMREPEPDEDYDGASSGISLSVSTGLGYLFNSKRK